MFNFLSIFWFCYVHSFISKISGFFSHMTIPVFMRYVVIRLYAWYTSSKLYEAVKKEKEFKNIYEFFTREIKQRPIDKAELVAPVDCAITALGNLQKRNFMLEQIKGIDYPFEEILALRPEEVADLRSRNLYFVTIHLPISECHRFRSPVDWVVKKRVHVPGFMYRLAHANMFGERNVLYNERAVLQGEWSHGVFYFVPLAGFKVGEIALKFDPELETNVIGEAFRPGADEEFVQRGLKVHVRRKDFTEGGKKKGVQLKKGEEFGHFKGGSAFVMIFEHEPNFKFCIQPQQYVLYGNRLEE